MQASTIRALRLLGWFILLFVLHIILELLKDAGFGWVNSKIAEAFGIDTPSVRQAFDLLYVWGVPAGVATLITWGVYRLGSVNAGPAQASEKPANASGNGANRGELTRRLNRNLVRLIDANVVIRLAAIHDLAELFKTDQDLSKRVIAAFCHRIRDISPNLKEDNREVDIISRGRNKFSTNLRDIFTGGDIHTFAQHELKKDVVAASREVQEIISALI
jgi:hypothetical protein